MTYKYKRCFLLSIFFILFLISLSSVYSVGVRRFSYDIPEYEFKPGLEFTVEYEAIGASRDTKLELTGQFAKHATLSRSFIALSDSNKRFTLSVKIPDDANSLDYSPGTNGLRLAVRDDFSKSYDEHVGMFRVSTSATTPIRIHVPYPGDYAELSEYELPYVNNGINTSLKFTIWNRGYNDHIGAHYEFFVKNNKGETLLSKTKININIPSQERKTFYIIPIESSTLTPGNYNTTLNYYYADKVLIKDYTLKIGQLNVDIINHTSRLFNDSIQRFDITIRSDWNEIIPNVYANIMINSTEAKTTPADIGKFQEKTLTAHIDTAGISIGNHTVNLTLFYASKSKHEFSVVEIIEKPIIKEQAEINWLMIALIVIIILLLVIAIVFIIIFMRKSKNKSLNKQKKIKQ